MFTLHHYCLDNPQIGVRIKLGNNWEGKKCAHIQPIVPIPLKIPPPPHSTPTPPSAKIPPKPHFPPSPPLPPHPLSLHPHPRPSAPIRGKFPRTQSPITTYQLPIPNSPLQFPHGPHHPPPPPPAPALRRHP